MNIALMRRVREFGHAADDGLEGMSGAVPCARPFTGAQRKNGWSLPQADSRWMANQLLQIQENERRRIAADLHDGLGQSLTMIKLALAETSRLLSSGAIGEAADSLQQLKLKAHDALNEMRHVILDLRPPMLDDLGILPTLTWFLREIGSVCPELKVEKNFSVEESSIPDALKVTLFRIVQEATSNIVKYAKASRVRVSLAQAGDTLSFSIDDNGEGFDFSQVIARNGSAKGLGLLSMKERATLSGGEYTLVTTRGAGTHISVTWDLSKLAGH